MKFLKNSEYEKMLHEKEVLAIKLQDKEKQLEAELEARKKVEIDGKSVVVTPGASSGRDLPNTYDFLHKSLQTVKPEFDPECIVLIRKLCRNNPDFSQVIGDLTRLANTGHKITFDPSVGEAEIEKMRLFIVNSSKHWHVGSPGVNLVVNKMFKQVFTGGAIANEWIPSTNLDDIEELRFIAPERIRFVVEKNTKGYQPYQQIKNKPIQNITLKELRKLNNQQFKYVALNGDTDLPYGIPPFMAALDPAATQKHIMDNLKYVAEYLGLMGYLDFKIAKPAMQAGEGEAKYTSRLEKILEDAKARLMVSRRDGVTVSFMEESETQFNSTTKDAKGITEIHALNENLVASGLGTDPVFMGRPGASETLVTVMFTKMIAQLKNIQDLVKENLEYGYRLLLTLGGFKFKNLSVEFNPSTITDDLKFQQAQEIKLRNLVIKYHYGIISLEKFADELGYIKADMAKPRIDINQSDPMTGEIKKQNREKDKDKSARKSRDKKAPRGTVRKQNNSSKPELNNHEAKVIQLHSIKF